MHGRRLGAALTGLALLFTMAVGIAGASELTPGPLVQVSGTSPFLSCTADAIGSQSGTVYLNSEVEPWIDVNRTNTSNVVGIFQQDRWSNGGARGLVAGVSFNGGASCTLVPIPKVTVCSGGTAANGGNYQRATDPWVTLRPQRQPVPAVPVLQRRSPPFTTEDFDHALLASKSTNGGLTWTDPVVVIRDTAPTSSTTSSRSRQTRRTPVSSTRSGIDSSSRERSGERRGVVPCERLPGPDLVRPEHERRPVVGAGAPDLRPGPERPDDRQPDRRAAGRHAGGHLHRVQQRKHEASSAAATVRVLRSTDKGVTWSGPFLVDRLGTIGDQRSRDRCTPSGPATSSRTSRSTARTGGLYAVWQDARFSGGQNDGDRVLAVARRRAHVVDADQGQPDADENPVREPAGVHAVRRGCQRRHDRRHLLRLPQQHGRSEHPVDRLLRRPLPPDDGDRMHEPTSWGNEDRLTDVPFDMRRRALRGRLLHGRLRRPRGDRRLPGALLAAARQRSVERLLPAPRAVAPRWRGASSPRHHQSPSRR